MGLIDRSNESKGKPFYVHIFTCDMNGNILPSDEFQKVEKSIGKESQKAAKRELENVIESKLKKLATMSNF
jgi:histone H3/H4